MRNLLNERIKNAFVVAGGSDPIFQLLAQDVLDIDAVDINEMEYPIFTLKKAAFRTLNSNEYESFFLDRNNRFFYDADVFKVIKDGFDKNDNVEKRFWELFFKTTDREEIKTYFFKGGLEAVPIDIMRKSLLFTKKKGLYYKIRNNLEKANINFQNKEAIDYLLNINKTYDYVDITNILLFMIQIEKENFENVINNLKRIYESKLNQEGIFVLDYLFGTDIQSFEKNELVDEYGKIYQNIYKYLKNYFELETMEVLTIPHVTSLNGHTDTIIYVRNLKK